MNFQGLGKVESADWYIDLAFRSANKLAKGMKEQMRASPDSIKRVEISKISEIKKVLSRHFSMILTAFPSIDSLPEFYQQLLRVTLDYAELKKSLGGVRWAEQKIMFFSDSYSNKIKRCHDFKRMVGYSREYYGRICSVIKQVKKQLVYLEHSRRVMKEYPIIKTKTFTVAIAGFPNVGKTTLLSKLTGSTPEIADYAFTTKKLNVGYATINNHKVQFIDTPGTLNRFEKMNLIEQQAYLAMKYCADMIVFVFDSSDSTYDAKDQKRLLGAVGKIGKDVIVYASKMDLEHAVLPKIPKTKIFQDIDTLKTKLAHSLGGDVTN
jgi:nucleolar GTP-binding protein